MSLPSENVNNLLAGHQELTLQSGKMDRGLQLFLDHITEIQEHADHIGSLTEVSFCIIHPKLPFTTRS